jgi:hypothetical protein
MIISVLMITSAQKNEKDCVFKKSHLEWPSESKLSRSLRRTLSDKFTHNYLIRLRMSFLIIPDELSWLVSCQCKNINQAFCARLKYPPHMILTHYEGQSRLWSSHGIRSFAQIAKIHIFFWMVEFPLSTSEATGSIRWSRNPTSHLEIATCHTVLNWASSEICMIYE